MLNIEDLTYRLGPRLLFDHASAAVPLGAKVGFVGRNGAGKTTLFRLVSNEIYPEGGACSYPKAARIGRVEQEAPGGPGSLIDFVLLADVERAALLEEAEEGLQAEEEEAMTQMADVLQHFEEGEEEEVRMLRLPRLVAEEAAKEEEACLH